MISQNLLFKNILLQSMCVCVSVQCECRAQSPKEVLDPLELELRETGLLPWCGELDLGPLQEQSVLFLLSQTSSPQTGFLLLLT